MTAPEFIDDIKQAMESYRDFARLFHVKSDDHTRYLMDAWQLEQIVTELESPEPSWDKIETLLSPFTNIYYPNELNTVHEKLREIFKEIQRLRQK